MDSRLVIPDNQYLNIRVYNTNPSFRIDVKYDETRSTPIITNPNEYYMSVLRFSLPLSSTPLFRFKFINGDPSLGSIYTVTLVNGVNQSTQQLVFNLPNVSGRYSIFQIQQVLDMINSAIEVAAIILGIPAPYPYTKFNHDTQLISFVYPDIPGWVSTYSPPNTPFQLTNQYQLWMNYNLYKYFFGLDALFLNQQLNNNPPDGKGYYIVVQDSNNGNYIPGVSYTMEQEFVTVSGWSDIISVVFTTSLIPVNKEAVAVKLANGDTVSLAIITDIVVEKSASLASERTDLLYVADPLRLIDLKSSMPLRSFDFQVYYTDSEGIFYPAQLYPGQVCTLKLGFYKKSLFSNAWDN